MHCMYLCKIHIVPKQTVNDLGDSHVKSCHRHVSVFPGTYAENLEFEFRVQS
jgi:hypothetical protein